MCSNIKLPTQECLDEITHVFSSSLTKILGSNSVLGVQQH